MALDHYVSQVHLRNFYSTDFEMKRMYAIRKDNLRQFAPDAKSVCRIEENSTNPFLEDTRIVEEFLRTIEGKYNKSIKNIEYYRIDKESIYVISGFISYIMSCSPTGIRIFSKPIEEMVKTGTKILEEKGLLPQTPSEMGGLNFQDLTSERKIKLNINPKYTQSIGIQNILKRVSIFGNSSWEILRNKIHKNPFFTSDYPIGIEETDDPRVVNWIVPLSPILAIRIRPNINQARKKVDFDFPEFKIRDLELRRQEVIQLNRLLVRCADNMIFYSENLKWIKSFIQNNRSFRADCRTSKIPTENGEFLIFQQRISRTK